MIQFDFDSILLRLKNNLQSRLDNTGLLFYSSNQKLLEAIAEELSEEMKYDEYLTMESKWKLAQNRSSIMSQSDFFNYKPYRYTGSSGYITVSASATFNGSYSRSILIPKFTQFSTGDINFVSSQPVSLLPSQTRVSVPVVQGTYRMSQFEITPAFTESQLYSLELEEDNNRVENSLYEVRVNGELWSEVENFSLSPSATSQVYILKNKADFSGVIIQFGDNIQGKKLEYGDIVTFQYIETLGPDGEVLQTNSVNEVTDIILDSQGREVTLYCTNESSIIGGRAYESINSIREKAPKSLSLSSRIITSDDYKSFILGTGIADKIAVWGEAEYNIDLNRPVGTFVPYEENKINITALVYSLEEVGTPISEGQKTAIRESVSSIKGLTDILNFVDPIITFLRFETTAYYDNNLYLPDQVINSITNSINSEYSLEEVDFKQPLYFSQYYQLINSLEEVSYHTTDVVMIQYNSEIEYIGTSYYFYLQTFHRNLFTESVSIFVKNIDSTLPDDHPHKDWFKIGTDDGSGAFVGEAIPEVFSPTPGETYVIAAEVPASELSYLLGSFSDSSGAPQRLLIANGMIDDNASNYRIKFEFKAGTSANVDIIPTMRRQIFTVEEVQVSTDVLL